MAPRPASAVPPPRPALSGPVSERVTTDLVRAFALWVRGLRHGGPPSLTRRGSRAS